jgi:lipoprotein-anchoring transpeptidase ErfK/SrfK
MLVAALAVGVGLAACGTAEKPTPKASLKVAPATKPKTKAKISLVVTAPPGSTLVATLHGDTPGSPTAGTPENQVVPGTWYGYPSILPVIAQVPNWVEVRLAQRPNESVAWVPLKDVTIGVTPYRVVVDLATMHLTVFENNNLLYDFPAGIGTPDDPTVTGDFFITMQVPPPNAGYGPFVLVTSAHSDAITDWSDSGDAIIAIHGPIDSYDDSLIGTTGAAISHGCIRLHDADLAQLAMLPPGTPVDIVAS